MKQFSRDTVRKAFLVVDESSPTAPEFDDLQSSTASSPENGMYKSRALVFAMALVSVLVVGVAGFLAGVNSSATEMASQTYADEFGRLWYATDCPNADVLLLAEADGLPPKGATDFDVVAAYAKEHPEYRVIPRNGWVWARTSGGAIAIEQVEDFMLEKSISDSDQCPNAPVFVGIPVAFVVD